MAKKLPPQPSAAEQAARSRGFKGNAELAEQFGITDDFHRELVKVDSLPDPPATETVERVIHGKRRTKSQKIEMNPEEYVMIVLKEEAEEVAVRLERIGIAFGPMAQQQLVDYGMAILTGMVGGGTLARR